MRPRCCVARSQRRRRWKHDKLPHPLGNALQFNSVEQRPTRRDRWAWCRWRLVEVVLRTQGSALVDREPEIGTVDLLLDDDLIGEQRGHVGGGEDLVIARGSLTEPDDVGRVWEAVEVSHGVGVAWGDLKGTMTPQRRRDAEEDSVGASNDVSIRWKRPSGRLSMPEM